MLVGLLPFLALASSTSALVIDSPPASPSLAASATFGAQLNSPNLGGLASPVLPSSVVASPSPLGNVDTLPVPDYPSITEDLATATEAPTSIPTAVTTLLPSAVPTGLTGVGSPAYSGGNKIPNGSGLGFTSLKPLSGGRPKGNTNTNANANSNDAASATSNTKRLTNGQRLARGLGPLPPTRRMTAKVSRRSASPSDGSGTTDDDGFNGGQGNTLATTKQPSYVMHMRNPQDMSDMGTVTMPDNSSGNDLLGYSPTPSSPPMSFPLPSDSSSPFTIAPGSGSDPNSDGNDNNVDNGDNSGDGNGNDDGDDGAFNGPRKVLAAMPHKKGNGDNGDLKPGSSNYALLGMASPDQGGLLHLDVSAIVNAADPNSTLPTNDSDSAFSGAPSQLLAHGPLSGNNDPTHLVDVAALADAPGVVTAGAEGIVDGSPAQLFGSPQNALWTFHPRSSRLLAHFVNSDGNTVPTYFVTGGACQHTICLTGDVNAFKNDYGDDALEVHVLATADL